MEAERSSGQMDHLPVICWSLMQAMLLEATCRSLLTTEAVVGVGGRAGQDHALEPAGIAGGTGHGSRGHHSGQGQHTATALGVQGHAAWVTAESGNVVLDPLQGQVQVLCSTHTCSGVPSAGARDSRGRLALHLQ